MDFSLSNVEELERMVENSSLEDPSLEDFEDDGLEEDLDDDLDDIEDVDDSDDDLLPLSEKLTISEALKDEGNSLFKEGQLQEAKASYKQAIRLLSPFLRSSLEGASSVPDILLPIYSNLALVNIKLEVYVEAYDAANRALTIDRSHVKSLFRRATALKLLDKPDKAMQDLRQILVLEDDNKAARKELTRLQKEKERQRKKGRSKFQRLLSEGGMYEDRERELEEKKRREQQRIMLLRDEYEVERIKRRDEGDNGSFPSFDEWREAREKREEEEREQVRKQKEEATKRKLERAKVRRANSSSAAEEVELDEEDAQILAETKKAGYCYFRRDQSQEEKSLIGDITPKRIEPSTDTPAPSSGQQQQEVEESESEQNKNIGSAWNHAGTWEERDVTEQAKVTLRSILMDEAIEVRDGGLLAASESDPSALLSMFSSVTDSSSSSVDTFNDQMTTLAGKMAAIEASVKEVSQLSGDAHITTVRGTKRFLFDFHLKLKFAVSVDESLGFDASLGGEHKEESEAGKKRTYRGSIEFPEYASLSDQAASGPEVQIRFSKSLPAHQRERIEQAVDSLVESVKDRMRRFEQTFLEEA